MYPIPTVDPNTKAPPNQTHGIWKWPQPFTGGTPTAPPETDFIVPDGVYTLWVTLVGPGGSNNSTGTPPTTGASSTFGDGASQLVATGGGGGDGVVPTLGAVGVPNGQPATVIAAGSLGGSGILGMGAIVAAQSYGFGSGVGYGASGGWYYKEPISVVPGQRFRVSVGGVSAGNNGTGSRGCCIVEW